MNKRIQKLALHRETVRHLTRHELSELAGGATQGLSCLNSCKPDGCTFTLPAGGCSAARLCVGNPTTA